MIAKVEEEMFSLLKKRWGLATLHYRRLSLLSVKKLASLPPLLWISASSMAKCCCKMLSGERNLCTLDSELKMFVLSIAIAAPLEISGHDASGHLSGGRKRYTAAKMESEM